MIMSMKILLIALSITASIGGCLTQRDFSAIKFGSGGGVTGNKVEYEINPSGKVYKTGSLNGDKQLVGELKKKDITSVIEKMENVCNQDTSFTQPGNIYYFIEIDIENCQKKFVWGKVGYSAPNDILSTYNSLSEIIEKLKTPSP